MAGPKGYAVSTMTRNTLKIIHLCGTLQVSQWHCKTLDPERILAQRSRFFMLVHFSLRVSKVFSKDIHSLKSAKQLVLQDTKQYLSSLTEIMYNYNVLITPRYKLLFQHTLLLSMDASVHWNLEITNSGPIFIGFLSECIWCWNFEVGLITLGTELYLDIPSQKSNRAGHHCLPGVVSEIKALK